MAKIYETEADLRRDQLKDKLREEDHAKMHASNTTWVGLLMASSGFLIDSLKKDISILTHNPRSGFNRYFDKVLAYGGLAIAGLSLMEHFSARKKRKTIAAKLEELGPEIAILPPEPTTTMTDKVGGPRSLLEQAERESSSDCCYAKR